MGRTKLKMEHRKNAIKTVTNAHSNISIGEVAKILRRLGLNR